MQIIRATLENLDELGILFDHYRQFYGQTSDLLAAKLFLKERLENQESVIFAAQANDELLGFTQLYPSFTSVGMARAWLLNDLFVSEESRGKGVATALIQKVISFSKESGRKKIFLATAYDNLQAQQLYEKIGFQKDPFFNYEYLVGR